MIREFEHILEQRLNQGLPFIQVLLGPRQVGKTTGAKRIYEAWAGEKIFASADAISPLHHRWIQEQWLKIRNAKGKKRLIIFDEIQKISGWSEIIKSLYEDDRHSGLQVVLLGSASLALESKLTESLLGRYEIIRAHHWDFRESKKAFDWKLNDYLRFGGYPAAALLIEDKERWQNFMRDSVIEPIISRDISLLKEISKPALFRQTISLAMQYPAREISYQKLLGQLQDKGNATTIKSYLENLEQTFLIKILEKFSTRPISVKSSSPKIIPLAPALIHAYVDPDKIINDADWRGCVFEAVVGAKFVEFFRSQVFYWRDGNDEVDYVLEIDSEIYAIEVKSGRQKQSQGLRVFTKNFPKARVAVFTEDTCVEFIQIDSKLDALDFIKKFCLINL